MHLTTVQRIESGEAFSLVIESSSGVRTPSAGVVPTATKLSFSISAALLSTKGIQFLDVDPVSFSDMSVSIDPQIPGAEISSFLFTFSVPEDIVSGDIMSLYLPGFASDPSSSSGNFSAYPEISYSWIGTKDEFVFTFSSSARTTFTLDLSLSEVNFSVPIRGVPVNTIMLSSNLTNGGTIDFEPITVVTKICSLAGASIDYTKKIPLVDSAVHFRWPSGPFDLLIGDWIIFELPDRNMALGTASRAIPTSSLSGLSAGLFAVTVAGKTVTFTLIQNIVAQTQLEVIMLPPAGLVVPATGIFASSTFVYGRIYSNQ